MELRHCFFAICFLASDFCLIHVVAVFVYGLVFYEFHHYWEVFVCLDVIDFFVGTGGAEHLAAFPLIGVDLVDDLKAVGVCFG